MATPRLSLVLVWIGAPSYGPSVRRRLVEIVGAESGLGKTVLVISPKYLPEIERYASVLGLPIEFVPYSGNSVSEARNVGLGFIRSPFVSFSDVDDPINLASLRSMTLTADQKQLHLVSGRLQPTSSSRAYRVITLLAVLGRRAPMALVPLQAATGAVAINTCAVLRAAAVREAGGFFTGCAALEWWPLSILLLDTRRYELTGQTFTYVRHDTSMSRQVQLTPSDIRSAVKELNSRSKRWKDSRHPIGLVSNLSAGVWPQILVWTLRLGRC